MGGEVGVVCLGDTKLYARISFQISPSGGLVVGRAAFGGVGCPLFSRQEMPCASSPVTFVRLEVTPSSAIAQTLHW